MTPEKSTGHLFHGIEFVTVEMNRRYMSVTLETKVKVSTVHMLGGALIASADGRLRTTVRSIISMTYCECLELTHRQQSQYANMAVLLLDRLTRCPP